MSRRVPTRVRVALEVGGASRGGRALNISEGGLFLHTAAPVALGSRLAMTIALAPGQAIDVVADVVRRDDTRDRFGMRFAQLPSAALEAIRKFVAESPA